MSDPQAAVPSSADDRWSRVRSFRAVIWSYLRMRRRSGAETNQAFQLKDRSNIDELAGEVFGLMQAVPDDCEDPQAVLLELARAVQVRSDGEGGIGAERSGFAPELPPTSGVWLVQKAFGALNPEEQKLILMHLSPGHHYCSIAELLNMEPAHVLRIIREAYVQMRWHTEPLDQADGRPARPGS